MIAPTTSAQILRFPPRQRFAKQRQRHLFSPLRAACTCHVTGTWPACRAWDLRVRLAELVAAVAGGA